MCDISPMEISLRLANTRKQSVANSICPIESVRELFCGVPSLSRGICSYNFCLVHIFYYCVISFLYILRMQSQCKPNAIELVLIAEVQPDFAISCAKIRKVLETNHALPRLFYNLMCCQEPHFCHYVTRDLSPFLIIVSSIL
jgi:hypothetical protein